MIIFILQVKDLKLELVSNLPQRHKWWNQDSKPASLAAQSMSLTTSLCHFFLFYTNLNLL